MNECVNDAKPMAIPTPHAIPILTHTPGGGHGSHMRSYCRMDELAELEGFVTCYPDGVGAFARRLLTWNAGARQD